ncbi:hypothetical protein IF2G_01437 [Cordyceps javanica]|nr:hypothetical protein IF2G_01437 [Cordyceps javanica]
MQRSALCTEPTYYGASQWSPSYPILTTVREQYTTYIPLPDPEKENVNRADRRSRFLAMNRKGFPMVIRASLPVKMLLPALLYKTDTRSSVYLFCFFFLCPTLL